MKTSFSVNLKGIILTSVLEKDTCILEKSTGTTMSHQLSKLSYFGNDFKSKCWFFVNLRSNGEAKIHCDAWTRYKAENHKNFKHCTSDNLHSKYISFPSGLSAMIRIGY
jgi:hypothetical protein